MQDKQSEFAEAVKKLLSECELVPADVVDEYINSQDTDYIVYIDHYVNTIGESCHLLITYRAWYEFLTQIEGIFTGRVTGLTVQAFMSTKFLNAKHFSFRINLPEEVLHTTFEALLHHSETQVEALVPIYNIICDGVFQIKLANTVFHSGHSNSLLAQKLTLQTSQCSDSIPSDSAFFQLRVTGDSESRYEQIEHETNQALTILRFLAHWSKERHGNRLVLVNPATRVSIRPPGALNFLWYTPDKLSCNSRAEDFFFLYEQNVEAIQQRYGLDDLNHHYQCIEHPISARICRALEFYDSGTRAFTNWQTMYRYVASVNVALPTSAHEGDKISEQLRILIQEGGNFIGASDSPAKTWDEIVAETTRPFSAFYRLRSDILHGNEGINSPSDEQVEEARVLAHNTVRLMAKLARQYSWNTYRDAKRWFEARIAKD